MPTSLRMAQVFHADHCISGAYVLGEAMHTHKGHLDQQVRASMTGPVDCDISTRVELSTASRNSMH